jgi:hypothetical protein
MPSKGIIVELFFEQRLIIELLTGIPEQKKYLIVIFSVNVTFANKKSRLKPALFIWVYPELEGKTKKYRLLNDDLV